MPIPHHTCRTWLSLGALLLGAITSALAVPRWSFAGTVPSFQDLGGLSPTEMSCEVGLAGLSNNGQVVVGQCIDAGRGAPRHAFRWDAEQGMVRIPDLDGGADSNRANAVSADGSVIVGHGVNGSGFQEAYRWTAETGTVGLGDLPGGAFFSTAVGVSADGQVIVGESTVAGVADQYNDAFRWTEEEGMVALPDLTPGDDWAVATAASADGAVIAGRSNRYLTEPMHFDAVRWAADDSVVGLGALPPGGFFYSAAFAMNANASVIVGAVAGGPFTAMRWTDSTGMVALGDLPGGSAESVATDLSDDGAIVVGHDVDRIDGSLVGTRAFLWDEAHGIRDLQAVLQDEYGLDLTGWTLKSVYGISGDGMVLAGRAINDGDPSRTVPWRAVLGTPGDTDLDGVINLEDLNAVRNHFGEGTLGGARIAGDTVPFDGIVDLADLNRVRNNFGAAPGSATVPEPGTYGLALVALLGGVWWRRRPCRSVE